MRGKRPHENTSISKKSDQKDDDCCREKFKRRRQRRRQLMCIRPTKATVPVSAPTSNLNNNRNTTAMSVQSASARMEKAPIDVVLSPPSLLARYSCALTMVAIFAIWGKFCFVEDEANAPTIGQPLHGPMVPAVMTGIYLGGLPLLRMFAKKFLSEDVDVKVLLKETMIVYNAGQVLLNMWMVYRIMEALLFNGHPFIGDIGNVTSGATFAVYIHYMDKYLEFFDTVFMVLRGRMDQVSFLHVYHHVSIAWAWWYAMTNWPGGDGYFGALLNSIIHVMMYSYYTLSLCKISCPWKRYLTQAQLTQFTSVVIYTGCCTYIHMSKGDLESKHIRCLVVQFLEMTSLFVLFMHFYAKAYKNKKSKSIEEPVPAEQESISSSDSSSVESTSIINSKKDL